MNEHFRLKYNRKGGAVSNNISTSNVLSGFFYIRLSPALCQAAFHQARSNALSGIFLIRPGRLQPINSLSRNVIDMIQVYIFLRR